MRIRDGHESQVQDCLTLARHHLETALIGLEAVNSPQADRSLHGAYIVLTFGRGVTDGVRRLRKHIDGFEADWYQPRSAAMAADPVLRYCYQLRNDVLHELRIEGQGNVLSSRPIVLRTYATDEEMVEGEARLMAEPQPLRPAPHPYAVFRHAPIDDNESRLPDNKVATVCRYYMDAMTRFYGEAAAMWG